MSAENFHRTAENPIFNALARMGETMQMVQDTIDDPTIERLGTFNYEGLCDEDREFLETIMGVGKLTPVFLRTMLIIRGKLNNNIPLTEAEEETWREATCDITPNDYSVERKLEADALARLGESTPQDFSANIATFYLTKIGDGKRTGLTTPQPLKDWMRQLTTEQLGEIMEEILEEAGGIYKDLTFVDEESKDDLAVIVARRDRIESTAFAFLCVHVDRSIPLNDMPDFAKLMEALQEIDKELAEKLDRLTAKTLLEGRHHLSIGRDWTRALPETRTVQ